MINNLLKDVSSIYIAYGSTDFRMQISSLCNIVERTFKLDPFSDAAFIFCNKRRTSIKVLCYDRNGFVLAQKTLLDAEKMKFQWPRDKNELKSITKEQLNWLLSGLKIYPEKHFKDIKVERHKIVI